MSGVVGAPLNSQISERRDENKIQRFTIPVNSWGECCLLCDRNNRATLPSSCSWVSAAALFWAEVASI